MIAKLQYIDNSYRSYFSDNVVIVDLRFAIRHLQACRKFTLEFTTIVRTMCFVNSNGWSHSRPH